MSCPDAHTGGCTWLQGGANRQNDAGPAGCARREVLGAAIHELLHAPNRHTPDTIHTPGIWPHTPLMGLHTFRNSHTPLYPCAPWLLGVHRFWLCAHPSSHLRILPGVCSRVKGGAPLLGEWTSDPSDGQGPGLQRSGFPPAAMDKMARTLRQSRDSNPTTQGILRCIGEFGL